MRYTENEIESIKQNNRLDHLLPSLGFELHKHGNDLKILCPFHDDKNPSLIITPEKNLWHCLACNEGGSIIDFVMKYRKLSFLDAVGQLTSAPSTGLATEPKATLQKFIPRAKLLERVTAFYQKAFRDDGRGLHYLQSRGIKNPSIFEAHRIGFCNGTLFKAIPENGEIIEQLKAIGILQDNNRESFEDCVIFPILNASGVVVTLYARKINDSCEVKHLYLSGTRQGLFNGLALKSYPEIILTESIIDALSLMQSGIKNVIPCYGTNGFTDFHLEQLKASKTKDLIILFDNDEAGSKGSLALKSKLQEHFLSCEILELPSENDINDYLLKHGEDNLFSFLAAKKKKLSVSAGVITTGENFLLEYCNRKYFVRGIESGKTRLRVNIKAENCTRFHIDTFDLYSSKSRREFMKECSLLFKQEPEIIEQDILKLITAIEGQLEKGKLKAESTSIDSSEADVKHGLVLGKHKNLMEQIVKDMEALGYLGEENNKRIAYLAMTSRKMKQPLSVMILSASGAGKSALQDTTLKLCPDDERVKLTTISEKALFYKEADSLKHKVLAIAEDAGAENAAYAIRNLISSGELIIESTIKDPITGRMTTMQNTVKGPTSVFKTTTSIHTDPETRSRFIILTVDESKEQTSRVLNHQRSSHTLEGFILSQKRHEIIKKHQSFQKLLRPLPVFNPYAELLTYDNSKLWVRRDNPKYLCLIDSIAFLHQLQRPLKRKDGIEYIEVTLEDIALANELFGEILGRSLDDLSTQARRLLEVIKNLIKARTAENNKITRREIREACGWGESYVRIILNELVRLEYLYPIKGGLGREYSYELLLNQEQAGFGKYLQNMETLKEKALKLGLCL